MDSKEIREAQFNAWWAKTVNSGQWTTLERLAAHDAWLAALSTIDPEAIRRETKRACMLAADEWAISQLAIRSQREALGAAILGAEPAQDESEESKNERLATKRELGAGCHDECGELPAEDDAGCEVHVFRGPATEVERMANIERMAKAAEPAQDDGKAEVKSIGGANTLDELIGLMEIARTNKTGITLDWVEVGILMRSAEVKRRIEEAGE